MAQYGWGKNTTDGQVSQGINGMQAMSDGAQNGQALAAAQFSKANGNGVNLNAQQQAMYQLTQLTNQQTASGQGKPRIVTLPNGT